MLEKILDAIIEAIITIVTVLYVTPFTIYALVYGIVKCKRGKMELEEALDYMEKLVNRKGDDICKLIDKVM